MRQGRYEIQISWGDCDAAGIAFYPRYFSWFDAATWRMFNQAGWDAARLMSEYGVFLPLMEVRAQFKRPSVLDDDLVLESHVSEWQDKRFRVHHVIFRNDEMVLEGMELRCWAKRHPDDPLRLQGATIPAEIRRAFE